MRMIPEHSEETHEQAMQALVEKGLVFYDRNGQAALTKQGYKAALEVVALRDYGMVFPFCLRKSNHKN
jgi:Mn-dependent DtxR family transcriptional regulator